jgi:hypothetical protein
MAFCQVDSFNSFAAALTLSVECDNTLGKSNRIYPMDAQMSLLPV